jgi:hypothetical protein
MSWMARLNYQKAQAVSLAAESGLNLANTRTQCLGHSMAVRGSSFVTRIDEGHGSGFVSAQRQLMIMPRVLRKGKMPEYLF